MASGGILIPTKAIFGLMNFRSAGIMVRAKGLPGQAKFGAWFHTADFADPFFDEDGIPLADEDSSGNPQTHAWNYGFYWILDQMFYREPGKADPVVGI